MKFTATKLIAIELTNEEKEALEIAHDVLANFNNRAVTSFEEELYQSPLFGDIVDLEEIPRVLGIIDFFRNNPIVHAIERE